MFRIFARERTAGSTKSSSPPTSRTYEEQVAQQIAQYAETVNIHELPESFHFWSHNYIRPGMEAVFGTSSVTGIYVDACKSVSDGTCKILSIGCGDGSVEMDVAKELIAGGFSDFVITGVDLSPILLQRFRDKVSSTNLGKHFEIVEQDLNDIRLPGSFDVVMANHALHHIVELEKLFAYAFEHMRDDGIFVTNDMIGRNGHMRWPETRRVLELFWPLLKPQQRYHAQLRRLEEQFMDHDCSTEGFEGIRAQDILPLMLHVFHPYKFLGVGGFIDAVVDRSFGHGFDMNNENDKAMIRCIAEINDLLLDSGCIKPTIMLAQFKKKPTKETFYRSRSAKNSLRDPSLD